MLEILCPWCGRRPHTEFAYGGDASQHHPETSGLDAWVKTTYFRKNAVGTHTELWYHRDGCRQWLRVSRDTLTHAVHDTAFVTGLRP